MKPTRGLSNSWLYNLPKERRNALISLVLLLVLLGSLIAYQRFTAGSRMPLNQLMPGELPEAGQEVSASPERNSVAENMPATQPGDLMRPLTGDRKVLQPYAFAFSEAYGDYRLHPGVDYAAALEESVMAAAAGRVLSIEEDPADGKVLTLDHGNGLMTRYASLGKTMVGVNATVQAGYIIGQVGQPGAAKANVGAHLHLEVLLNGEPVDPAIYLKR